jgi:hypothetical protein
MSLSAISETMKALQCKGCNEISVVALHLPLPNYERRLGIHVKCSILLFDVNQIWDFSADFFLIVNAELNENPSRRSGANMWRK